MYLQTMDDGAKSMLRRRSILGFYMRNKYLCMNLRVKGRVFAQGGGGGGYIFFGNLQYM